MINRALVTSDDFFTPALPEAFCARGLALLMQDKLTEAEADFTRCRALGSQPTRQTEELLQEARKRLTIH